MKTITFQKFLTLSVLICSLAIYNSCTEEFIDPIIPKQKTAINEISKEEFLKKAKNIDIPSSILKKLSLSGQEIEAFGLNNENELYSIPDDKIVETNIDSFKTYSLNIKTFDDSKDLTNLIIQINPNNEVKSYIIRYIVNDNNNVARIEYLDLNLNLMGHNEIPISDQFEMTTYSDNNCHEWVMVGYAENCNGETSEVWMWVPCTSMGGSSDENNPPTNTEPINPYPYFPDIPGDGSNPIGGGGGDSFGGPLVGISINGNDLSSELNYYLGVGNWELAPEINNSDAMSFNSINEYLSYMENQLDNAYLEETITEQLQNGFLKSYKIVLYETALGSERGIDVVIKWQGNPSSVQSVSTNWFGGELYNEWYYNDNDWLDTPYPGTNNRVIQIVGHLEQGVLINGYGIKVLEYRITITFLVDSNGNYIPDTLSIEKTIL